MLVVLGVHVQIIMIVAVDYTATIRGLAMCVHHVLILCGLAMHTIPIDDKCCPGNVDGTYDSTLDFAYASSGNSCCNQLDCGVLEKCVSASAMGITACACDTDRGKVAGVAFGVIAGFILLICIPLCWCLKCCCFKKPPEVVIVQAPQATVAQA